MKSHRAAWWITLALGAPFAAGGPVRAGVHLTLQTSDSIIAVGDTLTLEANIAAPGDQFNAFDLLVGFDASRLALVPTTPVNNQRGPLVTSACSNTFHIFTPGSSVETVNLSLLCANTFMTGPGVIYRIRFRALNVMGPTVLRCLPGTQFYRAGVLINPLVRDSLSLYVGQLAAVAPPLASPAPSGSNSSTWWAAAARSARWKRGRPGRRAMTGSCRNWPRGSTSSAWVRPPAEAPSAAGSCSANRSGVD